MMIARKFLSPWRALVAVAVLAVAAAPAQAGLSLSFSSDGVSGSVTAPDNVTTSGSVTFNGYTFQYAVSSSLTGMGANAVQTITLQGTLTGNSDAISQSNFGFTLTGGPYSSPTGAGIQTSTLAVGNMIQGTDGFINPGQGTAVTSLGRLNGDNGGNLSLTIDANNTSTKSASRSVLVASGYSIATRNSVISGSGPGSAVSFTATTSITAAPEPASVVAALSGLPCVGGVLAMARRRLRRNAVVA